MSWTNSCWHIGQPLTVAQESNPFVMFERELRTKLPKPRPNKSGWSQKLTGKMYADRKRHAADNPVAPGDTVLVQNTKAAGKLPPNFVPTPYIVLTKEGQEFT